MVKMRTCSDTCAVMAGQKTFKYAYEKTNDKRKDYHVIITSKFLIIHGFHLLFLTSMSSSQVQLFMNIFIFILFYPGGVVTRFRPERGAMPVSPW